MTPPAWKRTKIVCTLGPATDKPGVLEQLLGAGMDVARINTSHGYAAEHARRIRHARAQARHMGLPLAILVDLPGPKFRLGRVPDGVQELPRGARVTLAVTPDDPSVLPLPHQRVLSALRADQLVYLSDGSVRLRVKNIAAGRALCEVVAGGTVRSGSGINLPESRLTALVPTSEDRRNIHFAILQQAEWIGVSFVESRNDMLRVRRLLTTKSPPLLIAKIERRRAIDKLEGIIDAADGVMVARGDLGVETEIAEIPLLQKRIIRMANAKARPVITATQMLESMIEQERPTRAEVTDIANAVLDGADAVMLSGETAIGRSPVLAVETMRRVVAATEFEYAGLMAHAGLQDSNSSAPHDHMSFVACQLAARLAAKAIIARVPSAEAATGIARFRPSVPLLAATESEQLARRLAVVRGVAALRVRRQAGSDSVLSLAREWLLARRLAEPGDSLVVLRALDPRRDHSDTLRVVRM
jgi:pyruvate kinase